MAIPSARQAHVVTILNLKGGVGKTHAAWLLASVGYERQQRVLLVDGDTQGNLSNSFLRTTPHQPGIEQFFDPSQDAEPAALIRRTAHPTIDIIPASAAVAPFDLSDQKTWEQAELHRSLVDPVQSVSSDYDLIVFDCPPRLSLVSFAALCASDHVIVPLEAADWGAQGIVQVAEAVEYVRHRFNGRLGLLGYLVSRFKAGRTYQQTYLQSLRKHFGNEVFDTVIPDLASFERSVTDAVPVTEHDRRGRAASIARRFFDETFQRIAEVQSSGRGSIRAHHSLAAPSAA